MFSSLVIKMFSRIKMTKRMQISNKMIDRNQSEHQTVISIVFISHSSHNTFRAMYSLYQ